MKKTSPRKKIVGFGAWIKRTVDSKWERVGFLFTSRGEAAGYARHNYETVATKTEAIRMTLTPRREGACWADQKVA